tara:strand:- start:1601 stop:1768 length:168 start_codon:yes stop_codon:yes gene_type:complete
MATIAAKKTLFFSLKEQYESGRDMTTSEEDKMWDLQGDLWVSNGGKFLGAKIKIK